MRRGWLIGGIAIALAAVVLVVLAIRLTSDDSDGDLEAWAGSVCTSVADWRTSISELADVGGGSLNADTLRERIDAAEEATDRLVSELRGLGAPDVESGEELQSELSDTVSSLESEYEALRQEAQEAFDADSPTEFLQALASLAPRFQSLLSGAASVLEDLERAPEVAEDTRAELAEAFENASACQELRGTN